MARRYIGIDIDRDHLRVAVLELQRGRPALVRVAGRPCSRPEELTEALPELFGAPPAVGDRLAAALPASAAFVRWLRLPFAERRKIAAVLPLELGSQLPVPLDGLVVDSLPAAAAGDAYEVTAAAVRAGAVAELTAAFDGAGIPLQTVDITPFALAAGLREEAQESVMIHLGDGETTLTLLQDGRPRDLRLLPGAAPTAPELLAEAAALLRANGSPIQALTLVGPGATSELTAELRAAGATVRVPDLPLGGATVAAEFLPAVALARRAASDKERLFNLRRGPFALKSEWAALKRRLVAAAALLLLTAGAGGATAWLSYAQRQAQAEALKREMLETFRSAFPGEPVVVDVPLQMAAKLRELEERVRLIGTEGGQSPLEVLREVSRRTPAEVTVDLRDFAYTPEGLRLEGVTSSFEATNLMARALEQSPLFSAVQVTDAKMSLDGSQVDFRMTLAYDGKEVRR